MISLNILYYVIAVSVILIAAVIIGIGVSVIMLLYEIKKAVQTVNIAAKEFKKLKESLSGSIVNSMISFGKNFLRKKTSR